MSIQKNRGEATCGSEDLVRNRPDAVPEQCNDASRRRFLAMLGKGAASAALVPSTLISGTLISGTFVSGLLSRSASAAPVAKTSGTHPAEAIVRTLFESLTEKQRKELWMPYDHPRRRMIGNNWKIVKPKIGEAYTPDQQAMIREILKELTSEGWDKKFEKQMFDDAGGFENYHAAIFGKPGDGNFEWVLSGRHLTLRADGNCRQGAAFGGPIFYGHAKRFNEKADHPGNVFWHQAKRANEVFAALDGKQREKALLEKAPPEDSIMLQGRDGDLPGLRVGDMTPDQRELVGNVMADLLAPFREADRKEALQCVKAAGGMDVIRMSFYKQDDIGEDGVWDIWRLEGPAFVWHFRGSPHIHVWVNVHADAKHADIEPFKSV